MTIIIDVAASSVIHDGVVSELSDREMAVLKVLGKGSVVSRAELIRDAGLSELSARRCESLIMSSVRFSVPRPSSTSDAGAGASPPTSSCDRDRRAPGPRVPTPS